MKKISFIAFVFWSSLATGQRNLKMFLDYFPVNVYLEVYDSSTYNTLLKSKAYKDTLPGNIYNGIALYSLLTEKIKPQIFFQGKSYRSTDIGRFKGGPVTEEIYKNGKPNGRKIAYYRGLYPICKLQGNGFTNVVVLRRENGYGYVEMLVFNNEGVLISSKVLVDGEVTPDRGMVWTKTTSKILADGTITQRVDDGLETVVTRTMRQRDDGILEIIEQTIKNDR